MQLRRAAAIYSITLFLLSSTAASLNITHILDKYPEFSTFNHFLTVTQLALEINRRQTITICVVENAAMDALLVKHLDLGPIRNVLSLHVLLDYFDAKKLHHITGGTALAATVFQASGSAPGASGFVKITILKGGKVGFSPDNNRGGAADAATFVKSVEAVPYDFSVIQISNILPSPEAEAPAPPPVRINLTAAMSAHGCKVFADTLLAIPAAEQAFDDNIASGLTVFCPGDGAMKKFLPKFANLSADGQQSLLEYHGIPIYESINGLRSSNGISNTLATDGAKQFSFTVQNDGNDVTIETPIVTARIVNTLTDMPPVAIFQLDRVLMPMELFKPSPPPSLAPAPAPIPKPKPKPKPHAKPPKAPSKKKSRSPPAPAAPDESPADAPDDEDVADQVSDGGAARFISSSRFCGVILSLCFAFLRFLAWL